MSCDCLNTCGDDPWLKDGRVHPCKNFIERELQDKLALEKMAKVSKIAEVYGVGADLDLVILLHEQVAHLTAELETTKKAVQQNYFRVVELTEEISEAKSDLIFVERWAVHHASKPHVTPAEALSCIAHYPPIRAITKAYCCLEESK